MATPVLPISLPLVSRFLVKPKDGILRDEGDGVTDFFPRSIDNGATGSIEWTFLEGDLATFNTFRRVSLLNGHRQFCMQLPSAAGISCHIVRMQNVNIDVIGFGAYSVTADLEIRSRAMVFCECPDAGPVPVIGWLNPVTNSFGTAAHNNSGSTGRGYGYDLYAGVVDYVSGTVVWSINWTPSAGGTSPTLIPVGTDKVHVQWPDDGTGNPYFPSLGMLLLTAAVDGTSTAPGTGLEAVTLSSDYGTQAWAPEDYVPPPPPPRIGWHIPLTNTDRSTATVLNSGTQPLPQPANSYISVVGYTPADGTIVWNYTWFPGNGTDPAPTVAVEGPNGQTLHMSGTLNEGYLRIYATVGGTDTNYRFYERYGSDFYW